MAQDRPILTMQTRKLCTKYQIAWFSMTLNIP